MHIEERALDSQRFNAPILNKEEKLFFLVGLMWREKKIIYKSHMTQHYLENKNDKQKNRVTPECQEYFIPMSSKLLL